MFTGVEVGNTNTIDFTKTIEFPLAPHAGLLINVLGRDLEIKKVAFSAAEGELSVFTDDLEYPKDTDAVFAHNKLVENGWHSEQRINVAP